MLLSDEAVNLRSAADRLVMSPLLILLSELVLAKALESVGMVRNNYFIADYMEIVASGAGPTETIPIGIPSASEMNSR